MASTVTLGGVALNGPKGPTRVRYLGQTVHDRTDGQTVYAYRLTNNELWIWTLDFDNLTLTQKTNLANYFKDTARGPINTFTYVHTDGTSYANCRFAQDEIEWTRRDDAYWSCPLRLYVPEVTS